MTTSNDTTAALILAALLLAGCDQYANNATGTTRVNEITIYGNVRCVLIVATKSNAITCDWDHPGATQVSPK